MAAAHQCFPFYTYAEDGTQTTPVGQNQADRGPRLTRRENMTGWALDQFRSHYADPSITKWDIFHYVYAIHHPDYRQSYAANLRRELPRIPFVSACHPEAAESPAKRTTPNEGPMHFAGRTSAADDSIGPSARKNRGPQDDNANESPVPPVVKAVDVFRAFVKAGQRLAEIHVQYEQQPGYPLTKTEKVG